MKFLFKLCLIILLNLALADTARAEIVDITLLQLNDIYEIAPVSGGKIGGLARIASLRQKLSSEHPHTFTILAGDLLSPSALGTAKIDGEAIAGAQMISVMNAVGLDFATFGNHEFDLTKEQFYQRLAESQFTWLSRNVFDEFRRPFPNVPSSIILPVKGAEDATIKVGLIGVTIDSNQTDYVTYKDAIASMKQEVDKIKDQTDIIIAVTHLALAQDQKLAATIPEIDIILGGHEHENIQQWRGSDFTPIFKADSNDRTVYIHQLSYDTETKNLEITSHLQPITNQIPEQPKVKALVDKWLQRAFDGFRRHDFKPEQVVTISPEPLDGLEVNVRNHATNLTDLLTQGMLAATNREAELAIVNAGAIQIDDLLSAGKVTQYDVLRIMPFESQIILVEMRGSLLEKVLNQGLENKGTGGYLQTAGVSKKQSGASWLINNVTLNPEQTYKIAINDFLLTGKEDGLDYLTLENPEIKFLREAEDIRFALIHQLQTFRAD
ncbi:5'-nucleotidase/2',3'-cyclic phosphodiesterase-like hydrolase [Xenococcus sp. PCC 7305]|uniref:bifunctional metallophosphatase/5'-nucleotidase n=1 Tax=Xenococcus sp. PCC 7305 TaxID=102125 RepID=UPI0002ABD657|nr:bifunctional metallophosphatase/5'-nucleotidase [Xenococcus sp. PCC 7305]ELS05495.1 5'-nucleotidase/2',3'-cyclic phosphodiesterase-like hydrolase [Xenococcus sp. PCC 7305]